MALFRGVDEKLPALTQFLQVEGSEMRELADRFTPEELRDRGELSYDATDESVLQSLADVYRVVRLITEAIVDDKNVRADDVAHFVRLLNSQSARFILKHNTEAQGSIIRLSPMSGHAIKARQARMFPVETHPLETQVLNDLAHVMESFHPERLIQSCRECGHAFLVGQPERNAGQQMYCSRRCAARVGERRRRQERREKAESLQ